MKFSRQLKKKKSPCKPAAHLWLHWRTCIESHVGQSETQAASLPPTRCLASMYLLSQKELGKKRWMIRTTPNSSLKSLWVLRGIAETYLNRKMVWYLFLFSPPMYFIFLIRIHASKRNWCDSCSGLLLGSWVGGGKTYPSWSEDAEQTAAAEMVWPGLLASAWSRSSHHSCLRREPHIFLSVTLLLELPHLIMQNECAKELSNQLLDNLTSSCFVAGKVRIFESIHLIYWPMAWLFFPWRKTSKTSQCLWSSAEPLDHKGSENIPRRPCSFMCFSLVVWHVPRFSLTLMVNQNKPGGSGNIAYM